MSRLKDTFERLRAKQERAFMPFLVVGDPDLSTTPSLVDALLKGGADLLEFGFAFSDPPADGPVIQAAGKRAIAAKVTSERAFLVIEEIRARTDVPIVLLLYYNLILPLGVDAFYRRAKEVGVDAILVADLPLEEAGPVLHAARAADIACVFIVSELTGSERLTQIAAQARGFLYFVSSLGVTGAKEGLDPQVADHIRRIKQGSALPVLVGFGISTPEQVETLVAAGADGVIVGSALIELITRHLDDPARLREQVQAFVSKLKAATKER